MYHHKLFMRLFGDEAHFSVTLRVIRNFINGMLNSMRCARVREFGKLNETLIKNVPVQILIFPLFVISRGFIYTRFLQAFSQRSAHLFCSLAQFFSPSIALKQNFMKQNQHSPPRTASAQLHRNSCKIHCHNFADTS